MQRVWGFSATSTVAEFAEAGLGLKDLAGKIGTADFKALSGITSPTEGKRLGLTCAEMRCFSWTLQQYCSTGGMDGKPFSAKEVAIANGNAPTTTHLSAIWGSNWANTIGL